MRAPTCTKAALEAVSPQEVGVPATCAPCLPAYMPHSPKEEGHSQSAFTAFEPCTCGKGRTCRHACSYTRADSPICPDVAPYPAFPPACSPPGAQACVHVPELQRPAWYRVALQRFNIPEPAAVLRDGGKGVGAVGGGGGSPDLAWLLKPPGWGGTAAKQGGQRKLPTCNRWDCAKGQRASPS